MYEFQHSCSKKIFGGNLIFAQQSWRCEREQGKLFWGFKPLILFRPEQCGVPDRARKEK